MKYKIKIGAFEFEVEISPIIENTNEAEDEPDSEEPSDEPVIEPDPKEPIMVTLGDDPEKNRDILNEALERGDVVIGNPRAFLIAPGVIINGHTLDLAWSSLIGSVEPFYDGAYFRLCGDGPCIKNGSFEGHYNAGPGEEGYIPLETKVTGIETAIDIPAGSFDNAVIDNMSFRHVSGYVICPRSHLLNSVRHYSPEKEPKDGWSRFDLISGYDWVTARHGVGHNYCISKSRVEYRFYDMNDELLDTFFGIPGNVVYVPIGSKYVEVKTDGPYLQYCLYEYEYANMLKISNCHFAFNQRLGIANLPGPSVVEDCSSVSNGYPRADHTTVDRWDSSTSGFIDIEDYQSPQLIVRRCSSINENVGVASRAYELVVEGGDVPVCIYGGWTVDVYNHVGRVCHASNDCQTKISVHESDLRKMSNAHIGKNYTLDNSTIELCSALNWIRDFNCVIGEDYVRSVCIYLDEVIVGRISGRDGWFELGTKEGSELCIDVSADDTSSVRAAVDDCWGLDSNLLVIPNGHKIHECRFRLAESRAYRQWITDVVANGFCGGYEDCEFTVGVDAPFRATAAWMDKPVELTFRCCRFLIEDGLTLTRGFTAGSVIRFEDCVLNGEPMTQEDAERIAAHDTAGTKVVAE